MEEHIYTVFEVGIYLRINYGHYQSTEEAEIRFIVFSVLFVFNIATCLSVSVLCSLCVGREALRFTIRYPWNVTLYFMQLVYLNEL